MRFRRRDIADLGSFPSAAPVDPKLKTRPRRRSLRRMLVWAAGGLGALLILVVAAIYAVGFAGLGSERLRIEAEKALRGVVGPNFVASIGTARIGFDPRRLLAVEVDNVRIERASDRAEVIDTGAVAFGIRLRPLLAGDIQLADAHLAQARVDGGAFTTPGGPSWTEQLRNERGLLDPDLLAPALLGIIGRAFDAAERGSTREIALENVEFRLPPGGPVHSLTVRSASLSSPVPGRLVIEADLSADGREVTLRAGADRDLATRRITALKLVATVPEGGSAEAGPGTADQGATGVPTTLGSASLTITGAEAGGGRPAALAMELAADGLSVDLGKRGVLAGDLAVSADAEVGSNRLRVRRLALDMGANRFDFRGFVEPAGDAGAAPAYRFAAESPRSVIMPELSPEPPMEAAVAAEGRFVTGENRLVIDRFAVKGAAGETNGRAEFAFVPDGSPGIALELGVRDVPVAEAKQLWPWLTARSVRDWTFRNLSGGTVTQGALNVQMPPRWIGRGIPMNDRQLFGRMELAGIRLTTTGDIPPLEDAAGTIDFRGVDVDATVKSGTFALPSGRTVAARNAAFAIRSYNLQPVVGRLDADLSGDAAAIAELSSVEPINALRSVGLEPADFSGKASGRISTDVPLQKGVGRDQLDWKVDLGFTGLALAKPIDGQLLTEADGKLVVEPAAAQITASGKLSGMPAEITALEPLKGGGAKRERLVKLTVSDKLRSKLAPGLDGLVSGTIKLDVDASTPGKRRLTGDLTGAELNLPWVGWSKGPGIASSVSFAQQEKDGQTILSEFDLSGASFGIAGQLTLKDGALAAAKLSSVRLNRDDDFAVTLRRAGKGYSVTATGDSFDARSVVRQFTKDSQSGGSDGAPVTVAVDVDSVLGFNDERLSGVKLNYSSAGGRTLSLAATATTRAKGAVKISNRSQGGGRTLDVSSTDAGALLRFLDIYEHVQGGRIAIALKGGAEGALFGQIDARDFWVVNEPRLGSLVSNRPAGGDKSISEAVERDIDTSRAKFSRGFTQIEKGDGYLKLANGVLRGTQIGAVFQGTFYDRNGNMDMTGTFMPAYGVNRLFGELPIVGAILGNGRDRGLIGVTFKLEGKAASPTLRVNPLSAIAPGIFRSIFEF